MTKNIWVLATLTVVTVAQQLPSPVVAFEAEMETSTIRHLADGNVIEQTMASTYLRDSAGRSRVETPNSIVVSDPVSRLVAILDPRRKTAQLFQLAPLPVARIASDSATPREMRGENLGKKFIAGFEAEGRTITITLPANSIGNREPISSVQEVWVSPELQFPLLQKTSDPANGEITRRVTVLRRLTSVSPDSFLVPQDYKTEKGQSSSNGVFTSPGLRR